MNLKTTSTMMTRLIDDNAIDDAFADDTHDPSLPFPASRDGFTIEQHITKMPKMSELVGKRVLWALPLCKDGNPGWVMCEIFGGPPDPASAAQGITVQLRCSSRLIRTRLVSAQRSSQCFLSVTELRSGVVFVKKRFMLDLVFCSVAEYIWRYIPAMSHVEIRKF